MSGSPREEWIMGMGGAYAELSELLEWLDTQSPVETDGPKAALNVLWDAARMAVDLS